MFFPFSGLPTSSQVCAPFLTMGIPSQERCFLSWSACFVGPGIPSYRALLRFSCPQLQSTLSLALLALVPPFHSKSKRHPVCLALLALGNPS
jgi:hypothetical protein